MKNRYRIEIYDENKNNDLTLFSDTKVDKEQLTELSFAHMRRFQGDVRGYVFDNVKKKKITALILPQERFPKRKMLTGIELGLM